MIEIAPEVLQQLEQAQAQLEQGVAAEGPPLAAEITVPSAAQPTFGAAGSGTAKYVLQDHYTTSSFRRLWAHAGGAWRYRNVTNIEEQGLVQVAFAANRVDVWWDANNQLTIMRCWKSF